jgi:hypothetical protein
MWVQHVLAGLFTMPCFGVGLAIRVQWRRIANRHLQQQPCEVMSCSPSGHLMLLGHSIMELIACLGNDCGVTFLHVSDAFICRACFRLECLYLGCISVQAALRWIYTSPKI